VLCALAIRDAMRALKLRACVGITTGHVFVGCVGAEHRCEYTEYGDKVRPAPARSLTLTLAPIALSPGPHGDRHSHEHASLPLRICSLTGALALPQPSPNPIPIPTLVSTLNSSH
jgi:hypothetical protein